MTGHVTDIETGEPLWLANVYWKDGVITHGTTAREDGSFTLEGATGKQCFVSYVGYTTQAFTGVDGSVVLELVPGYALDEANIVATRSRPWGWLALLGGMAWARL